MVNIAPDHLFPVAPKVGDRVKVISGEFREMYGNLASVEGNDGIVEIDGDVKLLPLSFIAKMADE